MPENVQYRSRPVENIFASIKRNPSKAAIVDAQHRVSYGELGESVARLSTRIKFELGTCPSQKDPIVAVICEHNYLLVLAILGSVVSGAAYQPIDLGAPKQRSRDQLATSEATIMLCSRSALQRAKELSDGRVSIICIEDVLLESERPPNLKTYMVAAIEPAYYLSTSGSTGAPKGVLHSNLSLQRTLENYCADVRLTENSRVALAQPCMFTPSVFSIFGAICSGATLYIFDLKSNSIGELGRWVDANEISVINCSTTVFRRLLNGRDANLTSLECMYVAGEPMYKSDVERYQASYADKFLLLNGMGTTEISCFARFEIDKDTKLYENLVPIGRPYDDVEARIVNERGETVDPGEEGELNVIGSYIPKGYFNRPDLSDENFSLEPNGSICYRTGDRAKLDSRGNIIHLGRFDGQVQVRGQRVELTEVESALLSHETIGEALVIAVEDEKTHDIELSAFFTPKLDIKILRRFLADRLPDYMVPAKLVGLAEMPTNASGKIDRMKLKQYETQQHPETCDETHAPKDIIEQRILECFEETLQLKNLHLDSDFFECGGNSITATQLAEQIQIHLAIPFPVSNLVSGATPRQLATEARRLLKVGDTRYLVEFRGEDSNSEKTKKHLPIFCLPGLFGDALSFRALASKMLSDRKVYAFEYPGYDGSMIGYKSIEELAHICLDEIKRVYPRGPVVLVSYSAGGVVAFELARQLKNEGRDIHSVIMMDCYSPKSLKLYRARDTFVSAVKKVIGFSKSDKRTQMEKIRDMANDALTLAISKYAARPQSVEKVILLLAEKSKKPLGVFDNFENWNGLYSTGILRERVSGDHFSLIMPEKAEEMSKLISKYI